MKDETKKAIAAAFKAKVRAMAAKGNHVKWGEEESLACQIEVLETWASDEEALAEGTDAISPYLAKVINPSQYAQFLESLPDGTGAAKDGDVETKTYDVASDSLRELKPGEKSVAHPAHIRRPKRGSGGSKASIEV